MVEGDYYMPKIDELKQFFVNNFKPLYQIMVNCDHGYSDKKNPHHLEGSVWIHTQMVLDELSYETDNTLLVAALLPLSVVLKTSPIIREFSRLIALRFKILLGL